MDKKTRQMRKALGYDTDDGVTTQVQEVPDPKIPGSVFGYSALVSFIVGIICIGVELSTDQDVRLFMLYFSLSFLLAPALLIYPLIRMLLGDGKTGLAAFLSGLFGLYVQSSIKKKLDKWS